MHLCPHVEYTSGKAKPLSPDGHLLWITVKCLIKTKTLVYPTHCPKYSQLLHNNYPCNGRLEKEAYVE